ncbi:MAG TPA: Crp/Fnr family transcriptional regulator [Lachnospiraceae bacterium]|uniref:Crp/Fnr family transcriptional regulator n=1 Tax=Anaerosporobacter sp. TaxID=1872529 RepID=UPI000EDF2470|nr:Crp/Fnr family transcriptional regulator [Anaerosporobacter sp.]HAB61510.1 Crp/Fnr family transcriptional regulator [Lachnospiraceae bacterium]
MEFNFQQYFNRTFPFWNRITDSQKEEYIQNSFLSNFKKGQFVHDPMGQCFGMLTVYKGQLRVFIQSENGKEVTLYRIDEGETCTLATSCIMDEITFDVFIEATRDSTLVVTNSSYLNRISEDNVYVQNFIYKQTTEKFSSVMWSMQQILFLSFDKRLASYLYDEVIRTNESSLVVTHDEIAKELGSAREVVSRMLKYFQKEGFVILERGKVEIVNKDAIRKIAIES